jgi:hypothetical protein
LSLPKINAGTCLNSEPCENFDYSLNVAELILGPNLSVVLTVCLFCLGIIVLFLKRIQRRFRLALSFAFLACALILISLRFFLSPVCPCRGATMDNKQLDSTSIRVISVQMQT